MKIISFEYTDHAVGWKLEHIDFNDLTLLVGASGVGKTRILKALLHLKKIVRGGSLNGIQWKVCFSIGFDYYIWEGKFENKGFYSVPIIEFDIDDDNDKDKPNIEFETLYLNEKNIIERTKEGIVFNGAKTVKLSQKESVINLLKEEEQVSPIHSEFTRIIFDDNTQKEGVITRALFDMENLKQSKLKTLRSIRSSDENLRSKLNLIYLHLPEDFNEIKDSFIDVFPYIEDLKFEPIKSSDEKIHPILRDISLLQIKEKGIKDWIDERKLSSGMYRTLMHIAELYLCADGTVILIDEFENSLGINCIDEITNNIASYQRDLQFIITSHHPYIINNISMDNWKIISRKAGVVKNYNAQQLKLGKSKHESFIQLINREQYFDGVEL